MDNTNQATATLSLHAGHSPDKETNSRAVPIYQTTSYTFDSAEHAANFFGLKEFGNIYTRLMNPTTDVLEKRMAAIHGGTGALATSSGMAAITFSILNITSTGQNIVTGGNLYGGTYTLFSHTFKKFGIEVRFVDSSNPENFAAAIDENTTLLYSESIGNPKSNVDDIQGIADIAHKHNLPFILDNTVSPPPIFNPFSYGVDIVVCSLTKIIGGHGTSVGGIVIEKGDFDWTKGNKFPDITEPDEAYHGVNFWDAFGNHKDAVAPGLAYILKMRCGIMRDLGSCLSPFNAQQILLGIETLSLRAEKHCSNALEIAKFLENHELVEWVNFSGLESHKDFAQASKLMPIGPSAVFGFGIKGGFEAGKKFINNVKICSHLANILDAKSLVIHPASTTHQQLTIEEQKKAGVTQDFIRISVGIEDVEDIKKDLDQALNKSQI